jgi:Mce-associated membrane protein
METATEGPHAPFEDPAAPEKLQLDDQTVTATRRILVIAVGLLLVLGGLLVWSPWSSSQDSAAQHLTTARDSATKAASDALIAFNTADPANAGATVDRWIGLSGGALESKLKRNRARAIQTVRRGGDSTATILETAVSSIDDSAGVATVLSVVEIRSTPRGGKPSTDVSRFRVLMQRLGKTWRITYLETVRTTS